MTFGDRHPQMQLIFAERQKLADKITAEVDRIGSQP